MPAGRPGVPWKTPADARRRPSPPSSPTRRSTPVRGSPQVSGTDAGATRHHLLPDRPGHGTGRPGPGGRGAWLHLAVPSRAHPSPGAGRHTAGTGRRACPSDDYRRSLDPFVALATAVPVTTTLQLGTGVVLAAQHDPIVLAKEVATLDHLSGGRVVLGVGFGWNREEASDHGVDFALRRRIAREHVLCMQSLWGDDEAAFDGEFVHLEPCWSWPKPVRGRVPVLVGGGPTAANFAAIAEYGDGWMPIGGSGIADAVPALRAGRSRTGAGIRGRSGWSRSARSRPRRSSSTSPGSVSTRSCCGSRREAPARSSRCSTPMSPMWTGSEEEMTEDLPRREGPAGRPWSGGGREELAAAVRRLMELTVTSAPAPGAVRRGRRPGGGGVGRPRGGGARRRRRSAGPVRRTRGGRRRGEGPHRGHAVRHGGRDVQPVGPTRRDLVRAAGGPGPGGLLPDLRRRSGHACTGPRWPPRSTSS